MTKHRIGVLQGRLTPSRGRGIQFFPGEPGEWEREFPSAREAGLSSMELLVRPHGLREHPLMNPAGQKKLRRLSEETGISLPSVHGYFAKDAQYERDIADVVVASGEIGASVVLVSFFKERKLSLLPDEGWEHAHRLLAPAARLAREKGIILGIEAELPAQVILTFINQAEIPEAFGSYYDLGNQFACGFPVEEELLLLREKIVGVHVKDRLANTDPHIESASVPLGEGSADFRKAFATLRTIGYTRDLIIQGARAEEGKEVELYKRYKTFIESTLTEIAE